MCLFLKQKCTVIAWLAKDLVHSNSTYFYLCQYVQTGSGIHLASYAVDSRGRGPQIFQKPWSQLQILGAWRWYKAHSTLRTHNSEWPVNITGIWCFLLTACKLTPTSFYVRKNCNKHAENIRCHCIKFGCLGDQAPGICARLATDLSACHKVIRMWSWKLAPA